ncbi:MAG TPA: protein kinase [Pyrinomonadaceae bacterium]|nr:protein kinase [Pyrinomonadaceae bacterium]
MTPERWQQVKEIFNSAINYRPEERGVFISQACDGDEDLRSEVESLIASHERSGEFIDEPAFANAATLFANDNAELKPGQTIGTYEVLSFISRGGMGEVYLAEDKRLGRKVALKLLPSSFTKDDDRLRRFEQEARAASALNHPNIITIFEIREAGSSHVIATEFVEGETLRSRLSRTPLTVTEALDIAIQVADALAAAHKAGIIHRDIKPENIMLRPDGYVKVLDFGLAKLNEQASPAVAAEAPTIQVRTGSGIVIGTAGYMSPEQARGVSVDNRSDIFSLGAVIYEMLARRKPFEGDTPSDTLAAILKTEPPSLSRLIPGVPSELTRIVTKCLKKDREERYQVVKDLWLDLKALRQELEFQKSRGGVTGASAGVGEPTAFFSAPHSTAELTGGTGERPVSPMLPMRSRRFGAGFVIALLVFVLAAIGVYKLLNRENTVAHFWDVQLARLTNSGNAIDATISPDGKYILYVLSDRGVQSLWIRQVSTANDKLIVSPAPVGYFGMTFSPDGNDLYYVIKANLDAGTLYRIPVLGGTPVKLLEKIDGPVSFSPDGKQFAFVRGNYPAPGSSALLIANIDGTGERELAVKHFPERVSPIFFTGPSWSPDGKVVAASVATLGGQSRLLGFSVADGKEQQLWEQLWAFTGRVQWLPDMTGLLVVAGDDPASAQLWFVNHPDGSGRRITNDLSTYRSIGLTHDGKTLTTVQAQGLVNLWIAAEGDAEKGSRLPTGNVSFYSSSGNNVSWTPDGKIVFVSNEGGNPNIWITNPDGSERKQLTTNGAWNFSPIVSPDGKYIVFCVWGGAKKTLWRMRVDGSDPVQLTSGIADSFPSISPDSRWIIYTAPSATKPTLWKVSIDGGTPTQIMDRKITMGVVSPDGKYIAYTYAETPDGVAPPNRVAVIPFEGGEPIKTFQMRESGTVLSVLQWANNGKSVLYTVTGNNVTNVWSQPLDGDAPKQVTEFKEMLMTGFAWSRDGKQLACTRGNLVRDAVLIRDLK